MSAESGEVASSPEQETKLYKRRYLMLGMFVLLSASNALQWIEYAIIAHIFTDFYGVSYDAINWTSMIYMLMYMLLVFPGSWFLDKFGLRKSILIGAFGNCFGAWLKILSTHPDKFWLTFVGQTIVGSSQVFILGIPPQLAATWFGPEQVSTACSAGVFGNQLGIALGFLIPPWLVKTGTKEQVAYDLSVLFLISAVVNTFVFVLVVLFFKEKPKLPPSLAQAQALEETVGHSFWSSIKELLCNVNYMLLLITYGINVGVFYAVSTLLSQMVLFYHEGAQEETGTIGLLIVVAGMFGSVVCGYILDTTHRFKGTTLAVYILSFAGMILFTFTLHLDLWITFVVAAALGFFMTGYLPIGFEFAAELTFPTPEGTTSGLLNGSAQVFGVLMTTGMGKVMYSMSIWWCNILMCGFLLVGVILTALIKSDLRRQRAHQKHRPTIDPLLEKADQ
ncbi:unnamed protein product [Bursaphelenchus xylophilus]|uniref:(pine wood nematode) hypothetical protein n=1 Tax=Bursaphelenchus xylophilus TaxID=6326 RepID=A0A1I7RLI4_BURXY|nr:unnamed protein product [Bursaphelenchus xylophilus]CAG9082953.1 unnamed protein product [Bursaphelenchus xylophilus]